MNSRLILVTIFFLLSVYAPAWTQAIQPATQVALIARAEKQIIRLRWAPATPSLWRQANQYGYTLEKHLVIQNKQLLTKPVRVRTTQTKVLPMEKWQSLVQRKSEERYAAIALQALYGAQFTVQTNTTNSMQSVVAGAQEQDMRYTFGLMSADLSFEVAQAMGLGFVDEAVEPGSKYLYKLYVNLPANNTARPDTALTFIGLEDYQALPAPRDVNVQFGNGSALVSWNTMFQEHIYIGYSIERSEDGIHFTKRSDTPVMRPTKDNEAQANRYIHKTDSLQSNDNVYYYRVVGHTPFGDEGPPSAVLEGKGRESFSATPLFDPPIVTNNRVTFQWRFLDEKSNELSKIKGFAIEQSALDVQDYRSIHNGLQEAHKRDFTTELLPGAYFYRLKLVDKNDQAWYSFPHMVQSVDSIPPAIPLEVMGTIDSLGKVSISWQRVADKDVAGYKVFRSNHPDAEYNLLTPLPLGEAAFTEVIEITTLTPEIYYKVVAVDKHSNHSGYSEAVKVIKPDRLPPVPPVLTKVWYTGEKVQLEWTHSSSLDVSGYHLYRSVDNDSKWALLSKTRAQDDVTAFMDENVEPGHRYAYTLLSVDKSKHESRPSNTLAVKVPKESFKLAGLRHEINQDRSEITLYWNRHDNILACDIYRSVNRGALTFYKKAPHTDHFTDAVDPTRQYTYRIKVRFKNGDPPVYSQPLAIKN